MSSELLDIQPRELKFLFELKKQSCCSVRLVNKFDDFVAFKVKTTSPKKYCVRPNVGVIKPKSFCEFTVTMQAPKIVPPDMICKDKFLVQSTVVPASMTDNDIASSMFARDGGKYVEEVKLRVILLSPPNSPVLSPINGMLKQEPVHEASAPKDVIHKLGSFTQTNRVAEDVMVSKASDSEVVNTANNCKCETVKEMEHLAKHAGHESMKEVEDSSRNVAYKTIKDAEDLAKHENDKTLDHVNYEEDPAHDLKYKTMKVLEHPAGNAEYESKNEVEDTSEDVVYETVKVADDSVRNGGDRTLNYVTDAKDPSKNGFYKSLNHALEDEDPKNDAENEKLKTTKHLEQSTKDADMMEGGKGQAMSAEYNTVHEFEVPVKGLQLNTVTVVPAKDLHHSTGKKMEELKLVKDIEEMKSKLNILESKLIEAEVTISKLTEERRWKGQERETLKQELALLRDTRGERKVQVGFPFLFVVIVAFVSVLLGYALRG